MQALCSGYTPLGTQIRPGDYLWVTDFNTLPTFGAAGAGDAVLTETNSAATELLDPTEGGGVLKLTHTAADPDIIDIHYSAGPPILSSGLYVSPGAVCLEFGIRAKVSDVDDRDFFAGLSITDTDQVTLAADCCLFRLLESEATGRLGLVSSKDSVPQAATGLLALADATYFRAFFQFFPEVGNTDTGLLRYFIHSGGNMAQGQIEIENTFPDDVVIRPQIQDATGAASAMTASIDWAYCYGRRLAPVDGTG